MQFSTVGLLFSGMEPTTPPMWSLPALTVMSTPLITPLTVPPAEAVPREPTAPPTFATVSSPVTVMLPVRVKLLMVPSLLPNRPE